MRTTATINIGDSVYMWGTAIGQVTQIFRNMVHFKCRPLSIYVKGYHLKGLSIYPHLGESKTIKLIPQLPQTFTNFKVGDKISLKLKPDRIT